MSAVAEGLRGIFYSEFHPKLGPELVFQVPVNLLTTPHFDAIKQYIITKPELCNRIVTVNTGEYQIVGHPVSIAGNHYPRNHLLFTVAFVVRADADVHEYEPLVQKLALTLRTLETESAFIATADTRASIATLLETVFHALKTKGECEIPLNPANTLRLKFLRRPEAAPPVEQHMVPILVRKDLPAILMDIDLTTSRILPYLDGISHVKKIAANAQVDLRLMQRCIQCLLQCNAVCLVEPFQFSSVYVVTPAVRDLYNSKALQDECIRFVAKSRSAAAAATAATTTTTTATYSAASTVAASTSSLVSVTPVPVSEDPKARRTSASSSTLVSAAVSQDANTNSTAGPGPATAPLRRLNDSSESLGDEDNGEDLPSFGIVFKLYCDMVPREPHMTVQAFVERHTGLLRNIDVRRLIQFGLMKGVLRNVHKYPLREANALVDPSSDPRLLEIIPYLDGKHSMDAICCQLELSAKQLNDILDTDPYTIIFKT